MNDVLDDYLKFNVHGQKENIINFVLESFFFQNYEVASLMTLLKIL